MALGSAIATGAVVGITIKAIDEFSKTFDKASGGLGAIGKVATGAIAGVTAFATATVALTKGFVDLGVKGSEYLDFQGEFNRLVGTDAPKVLNAMKDATLGAVSELELFNTSNKLMTSGIGAESLPMLADFATRLGETTKEFGGVNDIMQTVGQSIATGRFVQLEQMLGGVELKGKSTAEILEIVNQKMQTMPKPVEDAGSKMAKLTATFEDMKSKLAGALEPAVSSFLDKLIGMIPVLEPLIKTIADMGILLLEKMIPVIEKLLPYVTKFIETHLPKLIDLFFKVFDALEPLLDPFFELLDAILPPLIETIEILIDEIGVDLIKTLADLLVMLAPVLKTFLQLMNEILKPLWPVINMLVQIIGVALAGAINLILPIIQFFKQAWIDLNSKMKPIIDTLKNIIDKIKSVIDWFKKMPTDIGGFVGGIFGGGNKQTGGLITQTGNYLLHKGEEVIPKRNAEGGGLTIIISGNNYGVDANQIAEQLQKRLNKMIKY